MQSGKVQVQYCPAQDHVVPLQGELRSPRPCRQDAPEVLKTLKIPRPTTRTGVVSVPISPMKRPLTSTIDTRVKPVPQRRQLVKNVPTIEPNPVELVHEAPKQESETKTHNRELMWLHHRWLSKHGKPSAMKEERAKMVLMRRWFEFLDTDGSGEIGLNELEDPLVSVGLAKCRMDVRKLIQTVDDSDNGEVNFDEFLSMMNGRKKPSKKDRASYNLADPKPTLPTSPTSPTPEPSSSPEPEPESNSVVQLFSDLQAGKLGDLTLPFPVLITAYRRRMLLNAHMATSEAERCQGHSVLTALETTRREAAIQEEEDAIRAKERRRKASLSQRVAGLLRREDVLISKPVPPQVAAPKAPRRGLRLPDLFDD